MTRWRGERAGGSGRTASRLAPDVRRVFVALLLAMAISSMDLTIVSTALPTIVGEMGALSLLPWVVTANILASTVTVPLYGRLSDLYGRRRLMQVALILFATGSTAAGLSQSIEQLIVLRAIQGAGSAGLISLSYTIVGDIITPRQRGRYQVYISAVFAVASLCGPLVGGVMVDHLSWRLAFYPSVPLAIITLFVIRRNLTNPQVTKGIRIDWLGAALLALGLVAVLLVATWGGRVHAWDSPVILSMMAGGVLSLLWFVRQEGRASSPILPLFLFRNREFSFTNATSFVSGMAVFVPFAYLPVFLQISLGMSATHSGLLLFPMLSASLVGSLISGRIVARWGHYRSVLATGCALLGVGLALLSTFTVSTSTDVAATYMLVFGLSIGVLIPVLVLIIQNSVDPRDLGVATASVQVFRQFGGSTGIALFGTVFNARLASILASELPPDSLASGLDATDLISSPAVVATMEAPVRDVIRQAVAYSATHMFRLLIPLAVAAAAAALLLRGLPLRDVLPHEQTDPTQVAGDIPGPSAAGGRP